MLDIDENFGTETNPLEGSYVFLEGLIAHVSYRVPYPDQWNATYELVFCSC